MAEPSLLEQVTLLNSTLTIMEGRLAPGSGPVEDLEDFKSALDDMRLRLWGILSVPAGEEHRALQERFRIRRATEMCRGLSGDLRGGAVSGRHEELSGLHSAATELGRSIDLAREHAF
jgi:hypothetical protein